MPSAKKQCICQLCTCGRHMCPHRKKDHVVLGDEKISTKASKRVLTNEEKKQRKQWDVQNEAQNIHLQKSEDSGISTITESTKSVISVTVEDKGNSKRDSTIGGGKRWSAKIVPKTLPIKRPDNLKAEGIADFQTTHQQDFDRKSMTVQRSVHSTETSISAAAVQEASWNQKQIPKTQKIKNPDTLTFSGPLNTETTHQSEFSESVFKNNLSQEGSQQRDTYQRPRTSLKMSGEFQSDSSYQTAFTPKKIGGDLKAKKGTPQSNLKPEGEMSFDTTSLDYKTVSTRVSRASEKAESIRPKQSRPASEIKIPSVPISDQTTADTDFKKWNIERPTRRKPADTLQLGDMSDSQFESKSSKVSHARSQVSSMATSTSDYKNWEVSRPVVQKPENNLKPEGDFTFTTTHDVDYSSTKDRLSMRRSILEPLTERTESNSVIGSIQHENASISRKAEETTLADAANISVVVQDTEETAAGNNLNFVDITQDSVRTLAKNVSDIVKPDAPEISEGGNQDVTQADTSVSDSAALVQEKSNASIEMLQKSSDEHDSNSFSEEQSQYVSWDQIRQKPIRPHSNLRQEGGMDFNTTNRSEFVSRSMERVKGIRPKETPKMFEGDFDSMTMNQVMFSNEQGERVNPIRPKSNLHVEEGDFVTETTASREFQNWHVKKPSPIVPKSNLTQEGVIDFTTTNNAEFEEKRPEKVYPIRPTTTNKIVGGETDLTTTNRAMHSEFTLERVKKIVPQSTLRTSSGEFTSETTNKTQFQDWGIDRPKPIKPVPNLKQEGSMDFTTMNQLQFEEKPMEKVNQFRPHTSSKITGDFDGTTTNQVMYAAQQIDRPHMIKPKGNIELEKGIFASSTTNKSEFQQWQQSKSEAVTPRNNLQQEGNIDFTTTNATQYGLKAIDRVSEIRPKTNSKITGDFDGTTTNQVMFQNTPGEKSQAIRPRTNLKVDEGNFADETTNSKEFQTWKYSKPSPIKPHSSLHQEGSIDFTTTNDTQFTGKTAVRVTEIRPAASTKIIGDGDFEGITTNQAMFQGNSTEKIRGKRPSTNIHLDSGKFEDQTTARREYQDWGLDRPEPIMPSGNLTQEGKMDFTTSNQTDFQQKSLSKVEPFKPHVTSPITGKFDGTTTNQVMFQTQTQMEKVHDIRPKDNLRVESGQFTSETTNTREYNYKAASKPTPFKPKSTLTQEGDFNFTTSNQLQFDEKTISKQAQIRPKTLTKASDGKFYSTTTNQEMFQTPAMDVVRAKKPNDNLQVEVGEFEGNTTANHEYQQWTVQKPKSFQLVSSLTQEGDMSFETTNSSEFKEREFDRVQQVRPKTTSKIEGDFEATTTNQVMFQQPEKSERVKPIRHQNNLQVEDGKFTNETTSKREFRQWVKMENRDGRHKKNQAAGVRSKHDTISKETDSNSKVESQVIDKEKHESWKLNGDVKETIVLTEHGKSIVSVDKSVPSPSKIEEKAIHEPQVSPKLSEQLQKNNEVSTTSISKQFSNQSRATLNGDVQKLSKDTSTAAADYGSKITPKVKTIVPSGNLNLSGEMSFSTTSQVDFNQSQTSRKQQPNTIAQRPSGNLNLSGEMDFSTTSQTDFAHQTQMSRMQQSNAALQKNNRKGERIGGSPTYQSWKMAENKLISKSIGNADQRDSSMVTSKVTTETSHRKDMQRSPVKVPPKRFKPDDNIKIESVPFEGESTSRTEFRKWETRRSSSKKRDETLKQEGKMEFDVTSNDYSMTRAYEANRETTKAKSKADQRGSLGQTGAMDFHTTQTSSYTPTAATPTRSKTMRPRSSIKLGMEESSSKDVMSSTRSNPEMTSRSQELTSTSRSSYVGHTTSTRTRAHRPTTSQKVGHGTFETQTTATSSFIAPQDQIGKARTVKPSSHNILSTGNGFVGETTYSKSFETSKTFHCPVIDLNSGHSGLSFNEEKNGHLFYAPKVQG